MVHQWSLQNYFASKTQKNFATLLFFVAACNKKFQQVACVAWRFCRAGRRGGVSTKNSRAKRARTSGEAARKMLPLQSPRGFSALARLYHLVRPTKTAMLRRLILRRMEMIHLTIGWRCGWALDSQTHTARGFSDLYHVFAQKQCLLCPALHHGCPTLLYVT